MRSLLLVSVMLLLTAPDRKPVLFEGTSSLQLGGGITFSPEGDAFYVAQDRSEIMVSHLENGRWSEAKRTTS
jgi:hypothetical protein